MIDREAMNQIISIHQCHRRLPQSISSVLCEDIWFDRKVLFSIRDGPISSFFCIQHNTASQSLSGLFRVTFYLRLLNAVYNPAGAQRAEGTLLIHYLRTICADSDGSLPLT